MEKLKCSKCDQYKPLDQFHKKSASAKGTRGYDYRCKDCKKKIRQQKLLDDPVGTRERLKNNTRRWRLANEYGISEVDWFTMFTDQEGKCAICHQQFEHPEQMRVDHNHTTGAVRDLLCNNCNAGLGMLAEDPERLASAINYLIKHSTF